MELTKIKTQTTWGEAVNEINANHQKLAIAIQSTYGKDAHNKGYFDSEQSLNSAYPSAEMGDVAFVGTWPNYDVYLWNGQSWYDTLADAYLQNYISANGDSDLVGKLTITDKLTALGGIDVEGNSNFDGNMKVTQGLGISDNQTIINNGQIRNKFGIIIESATKPSAIISDGTLKPLDEIGALSTSPTSDETEYEEIF